MSDNPTLDALPQALADMVRAHNPNRDRLGTVTGCLGITDPLTGRYCQFHGNSAEQHAHLQERLAAVLEQVYLVGGPRRVETTEPISQGHLFEFTWRSKGVSSYRPDPGRAPEEYREADWWDDPVTVQVRAWSLSGALAKFMRIPFATQMGYAETHTAQDAE